MSVDSHPSYLLLCDGCGRKSTDDTDHSGYPSVEDAMLYAEEEGWYAAELRPHYCSICKWDYICAMCRSVSDELTTDDDGARLCPSCVAVGAS